MRWALRSRGAQVQSSTHGFVFSKKAQQLQGGAFFGDLTLLNLASPCEAYGTVTAGGRVVRGML